MMIGKFLKSVQTFFADDETEDKKANPDQVRVSQDGSQASLQVKLGGTDGISASAAASVKSKFETLLTAQAPQQHLLGAANDLMLSGAYPEAIDAFAAIAQRYPDLRDGMHNNTGACYFFLGRFEEAVQQYVLARDTGYDPRSSEENIFEAVAKASQAGNPAALEWYLAAYPGATRDKLEARVRKYR
jgi:tetratricopeptide (TPR) repeat protein